MPIEGDEAGLDALSARNTESEEGFEDGSIGDDIEALIEDSKTYVRAELEFQKTRVGVAVGLIKRGVIFVAAAVVIAVLALIGLTVGLIIALAPILSAWGSTALVVLVYLIAAYVLAKKGMSYFKVLSQAFAGGSE